MRTVNVLMSTYNGEKYLRAQIDSLMAQENVEVKILVRDDGSSDRTIEILREYELKGTLEWYNGENLGSAKSFMNLVEHSAECDFYAFCDQDDYWKPEKLSVAVQILEKEEKTVPCLYYSAVTLTDENLQVIDTPHNNGYLTFSSSVVTSNASGCTMCFNKALRDIVNQYRPSYQIMHDAWLHRLCLAIGGYVYFDENSYIYYRQHDHNVIGGKSSFRARWKRRIKYIRSDRCSRSRAVEELYHGYHEEMTEENKNICLSIISYKENLKNRFRLLFNRQIGSTGRRHDCLYRIAVLLGLF